MKFAKFLRTPFFTEHIQGLRLYSLQNTTLVYYISFNERTCQRFLLVLYFATPYIFFVALFILDFLGVSSDIYF